MAEAKGKNLPCCPKCGNNEFVIQLPRGKKMGLWGGLALGAGAAIAIYAYAVGKEEAAETAVTILNAFDPDRGGEMEKL